MSKRKSRAKVLFIFILGILVLLYPDIVIWQHSSRHESSIQERDSDLKTMSEVEISELRARAEEHNQRLRDLGVLAPLSPSMLEEYFELLNTSNAMGRIRIPAIGVNLPIYHGISEDVLDVGVGHLPHSQLPIGGENTHSIFTAHTGLIHALMFTHLNRLEVGDIFIIDTLNEELVYKVDQIDIVLPHETNMLTVGDPRDLVTLITCTPYGLNTHRILVRGERYHPSNIDELIDEIDTVRIINIRHCIATISLLAFLIMFIIALRKDNSEKDKEEIK